MKMVLGKLMCSVILHSFPHIFHFIIIMGELCLSAESYHNIYELRMPCGSRTWLWPGERRPSSCISSDFSPLFVNSIKTGMKTCGDPRPDCKNQRCFVCFLKKKISKKMY